MRRIARSLERHWTLQRLVRVALRRGGDRRWDAIAELHGRGTPRTLALVRALARSASAHRRVLAIDIAAQLREPASRLARFVAPDYAPEETRELLFAGLADPHPAVVAAAVSGFAHRPDARAVPVIAALRDHADADMRWRVAVALGTCSEEIAVDALMQLARDVDTDVRDWATFGLGTQQDTDGDAVRALLWTNAHDADRDVRGEALVGLARRGGARTVALVLERLDDDCRVYELEAAEELAAPVLLDRLRALRDAATDDHDGYWLLCLASAITACSRAPA